MDASTAIDFVLALRTQMTSRLAGVPALADVDVHVVTPDDAPLGDFLTIVNKPIDESNRFATAQRARSRDESVTVPGLVQTYATTRRSGDGAVELAFAKASSILTELVDEMRDNPPQVGQQTRSAIVAQIRWTPAPADKGGWVIQGEYALTYTSRVP